MLRNATKSRAPLPHRNGGFSLIELLVAMVITLIMMGAVAQIFQLLGTSVGASRSMIETNDRLRAAATRLQLDLAGATAKMLPPLRPEENFGYFEYIEGPLSDSMVENTTGAGTLPLDLSNTNNATVSRLGDTDDILMFTTHSNGEPFIGKVPNNTDPANPFNPSSPTYLVRESQTAEVVWVLRKTPGTAAPNITYTLYRQVLLVRPGDDLTGYPSAWRQFVEISIGKDGKGNTLGDLSKRENRFLHDISPSTGSFPFPTLYKDGAGGMQGFEQGTPRYGEDVMLTNVVAFDVRAFDPEAKAATPPAPNNNNLVFPGDPGYFNGATLISPPVGAFVDLGYNVRFNFNTQSYGAAYDNSLNSWFSAVNAPKSGLTSTWLGTSYYPLTYDTWSMHYENNWQDTNGNGVKDAGDAGDEFNDGKIDQGFDGLDNDNANGVDDLAERETMPPYDLPLRGIQVTIRVYEPDSRQVREIKVVQNFVPE